MNPFQVIAVTRTDGWIVLASYDTKQARDTRLAHERAQFATNGTEDVQAIIPLDVAYAPVAGRKAEEADTIALALMAQLKLV